jgi:23S rRNA (uracil1939-C5)-methyltransferase
MGRVDMPVAPASFLQATAAGEEALAERVCAELEGAKRVADLFAGCGPFTVRLAERSSVQAFESHAPALKALERAIKSVKGLKPITVHVRDLFRRPLLPLELKAFDAVVLDPPRAGAIAQVTQIALARVPRVMMVSCDAATFARDAAILVKAGYTLGKITLVDQFIHSPHVELACLMKLKRK